MNKICTKCGVEKPLSEFNKHKVSKDGHQAHCRECKKKLSAQYWQENKERLLEKQKAYRDVHRDRYRKMYKEQKSKKLYGISRDEYEQRVHGTCDICGATKGQMDLDHCHTTGKLRGCLCSNCNNGLGRFKDNPKFLTNALMYLNRYK